MSKAAMSSLLAVSALASLCASANSAWAHVGVLNTQLPYAVAGKSYELNLAVPHGCPYTSAQGVPSEADTYRIEVDIPAGFAGARPILDAVFGRPQITRNTEGVATKIVWQRNAAFDGTADELSYRIGIRGTAPSAPFTTLQFNTRQMCKNPEGGADLVVDWSAYGMPASNQSPKVKVFPARFAGWNQFSLAAANEKHTPADVLALLNDFFADAQIVWIMQGTNPANGAWSVNPGTAAKIKTLVTKDPNTFDIAASQTVMIHATDVIWARF